MLLAGQASAGEYKVSDKIEKQESVDEDTYDAYLFKLDENDKAIWLVNVAEGDHIDVYYMDKDEYNKLKYGIGGTPMYYSAFSELDTDSASGSFKATTSSEIGEYAIVVVTHEEHNVSATYDINLKIERAPPPEGLLDMLCGLGLLICAGLIVVVIVIVLVIYYIYKRLKGDKRAEDNEEKSEVTYVDSMMRPGFDIGPTITQPPPPKKKKREKKKKKKKAKKGKKKKKKKKKEKAAVAEALISCPECGTEMSADLNSCPSCGVEFTYELECPVCGHSNPSDASTCGGCDAEFE